MNDISSTHELAKECIYTALLQLMEIKSYESITITDIVKRAGVSRMAYYRNYSSKDDILVNKLDEMLYCFQNKLLENPPISEMEFWCSFFIEFQKSPFIEALVKANLTEKLQQCNEKFAYRIFQDIFHWNIQDEQSLLMIYYQMGGMIGLIGYTIENKKQVDKNQILCLLKK